MRRYRWVLVILGVVVLAASYTIYHVVRQQRRMPDDAASSSSLSNERGDALPTGQDIAPGAHDDGVRTTVPSGAARTRQITTIASLGQDDVNRQVKMWWDAVKDKDVSRVRELDAHLPVLIAAAPLSRQSLILEALIGQHAQVAPTAKNSRFRRVLLSNLIAKVLVREQSRIPSTWPVPSPVAQSRGRPSASDIVSWSETTLKEMAGGSQLDATSKAYFVEILPATLTMLCRYSEDAVDSTSALGVLETSRDDLLKLSSTDTERKQLKKVLQQYHSDLKIVTENQRQARHVQALLDRYVAAYNAKDTEGLLAVFHPDSSASAKLKTTGAEQLIPSNRWNIQSLVVKRIDVNGDQANIDVVVSYKTEAGMVGDPAPGSLGARRVSNDDEWRLE